MKKVIIISDSHGNLDNVRKIVEKEKNYDMVISILFLKSIFPIIRKKGA